MNSSSSKPEKRKYRICYWDSESRILDARKSALEASLRELGSVEFYTLNGFEDANFDPCDLLITTAEGVPDEHFIDWQKNLQKRLSQIHSIWVPALIFAEIDPKILFRSVETFALSNWYFDVLSSSHISSLAIRVTNLLRIHDHLHELRRYKSQLEQLESRLEKVESLVANKTEGS